jgi:signal transduction histidine kinase
MSAKINEKKLNLKVNIESNLRMHKGDKLLTQRIILNLVSNAIKFTPTGEINISARLEIIKNKNRIVLKVKDTGIGIEKSFHKEIFEPFFRVDSNNTIQNSGIGLGLSNISLMLKQMEGEILVDSNLGQGTTFTVYL